MTAFARVASLLGLTEAALLYSLAPIALASLALAVPRAPRRPRLSPRSRSRSDWIGLGAYATDRPATTCSARTFASSPADWLDRSRLGPARYLALPDSNTFYGTYLESWNRDLRGVVLLDTQPPTLPAAVASIARDGTLQIEGKPAKAQTWSRTCPGRRSGSKAMS